MTARQLRLFYNEAINQQQLAFADQLDALTIPLQGEGSPLARKIRETR